MKIGIDGNLLCGQRTGMGTVVHYTLMNYNNLDNEDIEIILYVPELLDEEFTRKLNQKNIKINILGKKNYILWEQYIIPKQTKKDQIDVLWCPYNTGSIMARCKIVVTLNDVIYMKNKLLAPPTLYKKLGQLYRKLIVPFIAKKSQSIITISEYSKSEIINVFQNFESKINVIYLGTENSRKLLSQKEWKEFLNNNYINNNYILGFGSLEKRKNSMTLIKSFENIKKSYNSDLQLVLFGFRGWEISEEYKYIQHKNLKDIVLLGYVSEEERNSLYTNAEIFVFPSLEEGFGIPVLEAFTNNTPVITSETSSLPEVSGDAAILVDPNNIENIAREIEKILSDKSLSINMKKKGKLQLEKFDWEKTANQIFKILKSC